MMLMKQQLPNAVSADVFLAFLPSCQILEDPTNAGSNILGAFKERRGKTVAERSFPRRFRRSWDPYGNLGAISWAPLGILKEQLSRNAVFPGISRPSCDPVGSLRAPLSLLGNKLSRNAVSPGVFRHPWNPLEFPRTQRITPWALLESS